jgi:formate-dependent nitrite reductase cytochrome c552 subunit
MRRSHSRAVPWLIAAAALSGFLAIAGGYVKARAASPTGSPTATAANSTTACARCHAEAKTEPSTPMGRALELPGSNPTVTAHPRLAFQKAGYSYLVETKDGKTTYSVTDGKTTMAIPVLWSLGAGNQTWVLEREGKLYESLVSYYLAIDGLDITTGDELIKPHTLEEAMGRPIEDREKKACFGCHSTNSVTGGQVNLEHLHPGVLCARCHEGTEAHLADTLRGKDGPTPPALSKLSSEDMSNFCGQCHRSWETVVRGPWRGEVNVRFQPYRLANSRCFDGADPRISCVACHNPHQPLEQDSGFYDGKCLACHAPASQTAQQAATPTVSQSTPPIANGAKTCPVAKENCVGCHMPRVNMLGGHLTFTDHQIRIVKPGTPYPN